MIKHSLITRFYVNNTYVLSDNGDNGHYQYLS